MLSACARMGSPDGGWYDETPPRIIATTPADRAVNVQTQRIVINFDEFIKLNNATENVAVSPPQLEMPEVKAAGKRIIVELKDSLKPNTTYTIDFSDAISDNNEDNPLGNYTFSFSTGDHIDTLEVSGNVLEAANLEPVKGITVGLYPADGRETPDSATLTGANNAGGWNDSIFRTRPLLRAARTDAGGRFVIKGIAPGAYRIFALQDADGDYRYSQKSEALAFTADVIVPSHKPDVRQDTIWADSVHIRSITPVNYTHFLPDDIVLRAFTETLTDRYFLKAERKDAPRFDLFFSYGHEELPRITGLNFDEHNAFIVEHSLKNDTITYWLRDTALVNQDTLRMAIEYYATDTLGALQLQHDTLEVLSKDPYARRMKRQAEDLKDWQKQQEKKARRGEPADSVMPAKPLGMKWNMEPEMAPDENPWVRFDTPIARFDEQRIHLYQKIDTLWYEAPFEVDTVANAPRTYRLRGEWKPETEYSLEVDSGAFTDIYGFTTKAEKKGFGVKSLDRFSSLVFVFEGMAGRPLVAQLLDVNDKVVKETTTRNGTAQFYYINPGTYYLRAIIDENGNGQWDTGEYAAQRQPEAVMYYPREIECKERWDVSLSWNPAGTKLTAQKPATLVKQKDKENKKTIRNRNAERARELGIEYIEGVTGR